MKKSFGAVMTIAAVCVLSVMCMVGCSMEDFTEKFVGVASGSAVAASGTGASSELVSGQAVEIEEYDASQLVELGEYKGVLVDCTASDDEIQSDIDALFDEHPQKIKKGTAENGMRVNIDYSGKLNGKKFDGGTAKGTTIKLGESGMIPGFDDGIIGMKVGEKKDVELTFPEQYENNPDLAGKKAVFTMKLNYIEDRTLTDEYVKKNTEYKTVEEYKNSLKQALKDSKKAGAATTAMEKVAADSKVKSVPDTLLLAEKGMMRSEMENQMAQYGMTIADALAQTGQDEAQFEEYLAERARTMCETELIMEAIALKENVDLSQAAIDKYLEEMGKNSQDGTTESIKSAYASYYGTAMPFEHYIRSSYIYQKVTEIVGNAAKIIE
ncbi:MAG: FKBP-type peptidyl-prolyl cis-trans isomerase [Eubacterium sp.]|nr:FKBP-type peptidyl-prolyl cis-trans isomerase [Eubacterium sp.]